MYYKIVKTVTGNTPNTLDVVLKHQFTRVTTNIDASQVESTGIITRVNSPVFSGGNLALHNFNLIMMLSFPIPEAIRLLLIFPILTSPKSQATLLL